MINYDQTIVIYLFIIQFWKIALVRSYKSVFVVVAAIALSVVK